jgi:thiamine pyrophosphate-dependent acetolactate synthase large subunit-like protein
MDLSSRARTYDLRRREVAKRISEVGGKKLLVVTGLGSTNWDFTAAGDRDLIFPMWGAMGGAVPVGLGLALAQPKNRVLVATGDGEMLMGLGSLATVAVQAPANLKIVVFDNEHYGETGMQLSATADKADIAATATGCGIKSAVTINNDIELKKTLPELFEIPGPSLWVIKVRAESLDFVLPPKDGAFLKDRFRRALLGDVGIL